MTGLKSTLVLLSATVALGCGQVSSGTDLPPPTIESLNPARGPLQGGSTVTVTGTGFSANDAGDNSVVVGDHESPEVMVVDDSTLMFTVPPGVESSTAVDVVVFNENGFGRLSGSFTYNPLPQILAATPSHGSRAGDDTITLTGTGFTELDAGPAQVTFGSAPATNIQIIDDNTLTAQLGASEDTAYDPLDITLTNANGTVVSSGTFRYTKPGFIAITNRRAPDEPNSLLYIDPLTGEFVQLGKLNVQISKLALSPDGNIYAVTAGSLRELITLDPMSLEVSRIGLMTDDGGQFIRVTGLTFVGNTLYGWVRSPAQLVTINTATGQVTPVGTPQTGISQSVGIAPRDESTLFLVHRFNETLRVVNANNSSVSDGAQLDGSSAIRGHGMESLDNQIYATTRGDGMSSARSLLVRFNTTTGEVIPIGPLPDRTTGLTKTPPNL